MMESWTVSISVEVTGTRGSSKEGLLTGLLPSPAFVPTALSRAPLF